MLASGLAVHHPQVAAFFLKNGASVRNVRSGWIKLAKERDWSELLKLSVDAGVSAEDFLDDKKGLVSHQLAPTSRDREIQGLLHETLFDFGRLIEIAEGLLISLF